MIIDGNKTVYDHQGFRKYRPNERLKKQGDQRREIFLNP
jgi:hypothetical protein